MRTSTTHTVLRSLLLAGAAAACADDSRRGALPTGPAAQVGAAAVLGPSPMLAPVPIGIEVVASGFASPVLLVTPPGNDRLRFVVDQPGKIWVMDRKGVVQSEPFLDVSAKITPLNPNGDERGLLGLAFHPDFMRNGRFYIFYTAPRRPTAPAGFNNTITISEFRLAATSRHNKNKLGDPVVADPASERIVLQVDHPQANHNGGTIAFGPEDGYLYISIGDGGGRDDEGLGHVNDWYADNAGGNGQDISANLLGNILRIDVDGAVPYAIPADNPFVGQPGLDEVWAYGLRNPYRFSFDMGGSHALLVGDAGQELWEEVSVVVRRGNYGWNVKEGTHCFDAEDPTVVPPTCPDVDPTTGEVLRNPVIEFANSKQPGGLSRTVVGGNVYRGRHLPWLRGGYIFGGAFTTPGLTDGRVFISFPQGELWPMAELLIGGTDRLGYFVKGFGQDEKGEVYVLGSLAAGPVGNTGTVFLITKPHGKPFVSR